jgi:hypothetical protein
MGRYEVVARPVGWKSQFVPLMTDLNWLKTFKLILWLQSLSLNLLFILFLAHARR